MSWQIECRDLVGLVQAEWVCGENVFFKSWSTDTRKDLKSALFIALKGENHDAHDFLLRAVEQGAAGLLIHRSLEQDFIESLLQINKELCILRVEDTLFALQDMAKAWRRNSKFQVIAVTGSNGKTTTKEFCSQILSSKYKVYAPKGSLNNHWGVPFTLLSADFDCDFVFCEMGMNHPGEIASLCEIAEPDIVAVSMVGRGHLEGLGSLEGVAKEKEHIYSCSPEARMVFNLDNPYTLKMKEKFYKEGDLCFSEKLQADISIHCRDFDLSGMNVYGQIAGESFEKNLPIFGSHNTTNLMLAAGLCLHAGMSSQEILDVMADIKMAWGRNQIEKIKDWTLVFDAYNANPESMSAFLDNAFKLKVKSRKILILGEMLELGKEAVSEHKELAQHCKEKSFDSVHFFGPNFKQFADVFMSSENSKNLVFSDTYKEDLAIKIKNMLQPGDTIFIKASRGMRLERFLEILKS